VNALANTPEVNWYRPDFGEEQLVVVKFLCVSAKYAVAEHHFFQKLRTAKQILIVCRCAVEKEHLI
jgi:hypothetical protein